MVKSADILTFLPPPADLQHAVLTYVYRCDQRGGPVVLELPETRTSLQVMLGDDYWLCDANSDGAAPLPAWTRAPRTGLWGARLNWCYGYAAKNVEVFAIGLTPSGVRQLTGKMPGDFIGKVISLDQLNRTLHSALQSVVKHHTDFSARYAQVASS